MAVSTSPEARTELRPLSDGQLRQYRDEGYTLARQLVPVDALAAVRHRLGDQDLSNRADGVEYARIVIPNGKVWFQVLPPNRSDLGVVQQSL